MGEEQERELWPGLSRKEEGKRKRSMAEDGKVHSGPPKREGGHVYEEHRDETKRIAVHSSKRIEKNYQ